MSVIEQATAPFRSRRSLKSTATVGAVVVGGDYQGLGIVQSLGRRGIPTCVIDDERSIARFSRYATHSISTDSLREPEQAIEDVLAAGRKLGLEGWVLFPTRDETVAAFARYRPQLSEFFRVPTPAWESVQWAWDKRKTYQLAERCGIPAPKTRHVTGVEEVYGLDVDFPVAVKPAIKEHFIYATKAKAWRADSRAELCELVRRAAALVGPGEVMVQELIPGGGECQFAYCALFKQGAALASMVARRRRQHPPEFGRASTFVETVDVPLLERLSDGFLRAIDYYGLVEVEYKLDPRDGAYKLLDVNARTWGYHTLGRHAGVDFPALLFADQLGQPVGRARARAGVRWLRLVTDLPTGLVEMAAGRLRAGPYVRSLFGADVESVFTRDDPLPGLVELALVPYLAVRRGF
jgi:D-aspartate ligase